MPRVACNRADVGAASRTPLRSSRLLDRVGVGSGALAGDVAVDVEVRDRVAAEAVGAGRLLDEPGDQVDVVEALTTDQGVEDEEVRGVEVALGIRLVGIPLLLDFGRMGVLGRVQASSGPG